MTNAEIAQKRGQHPVWVAGYSRGRPPTDESMDILEAKPEPAERLAAYRRLREIVDGSDAHFSSVLDIPESRAKRFWKKPPTWHEIREMAVVYDEYHNQSFGNGAEEYSDLYNHYGPRTSRPGNTRSTWRPQKPRSTPIFSKVENSRSSSNPCLNECVYVAD